MNHESCFFELSIVTINHPWNIYSQNAVSVHCLNWCHLNLEKYLSSITSIWIPNRLKFCTEQERILCNISKRCGNCEISNGQTRFYKISLQWRHNGLDSVSNHQPHHCLLSRLFGRRSKKTSKLHVTGLFARNSPGTGEFPAQMVSYAENVSIWWRHHVGFKITHTCWSLRCTASTTSSLSS